MINKYPYRIPFKSPLKLPGGHHLIERCGLLLHNPKTGAWGDASPLPGYSKESLEDVLAAVQQEDFNNSQLPSLRFAWECLQDPFQLPSQEVPLNALWIPEQESVSDLILRLSEWTRPVVKVKPGLAADPSPLLDAFQRCPDLKFRVDGNRQWTIAQTLKLFEVLPSTAIDYFEEPLQDPAEYAQLWTRAEVPIALDECLLETSGKALAEAKDVCALVLKPTLLGNRQDRETWLTLAKRRKIDITWSSCFESGVGIWHLAQLASGFGVAGLDTGSYFSFDVVNPRPLPCKGVLPLFRHNCEIKV